jgi:hypothetical protein
VTPGRRGCSTERSTGCQKGKGSLDCAHCLFLLPHFPPRLYLECPLIATVPRSGAYALPNAAAFLTCVLAGGDLWVEVTCDASDAPAGGGSGGGRGLSSLVMIAKGRESLCFALWVRAILDEKRMTGESVNFRLNQMDFVAFILHA